jgi:pimeloyl-ACP methyl ester carboxylesterase
MRYRHGECTMVRKPTLKLVLITGVCVGLVVPTPACRRRAELADVPALAGVKTGQGTPVVFLHGLGAAGWVWDAQVNALSATCEVHVLELPGHGQSPYVSGLTVHGMAEGLGQYLTNHQVARPIIVGHSLGGMIALDYAVNHPNDLRGLVLVDNLPVPVADTRQIEEVRSAFETNFDQTVREFYARGNSKNPQTAQRIVEQALKTNPAAFQDVFRDLQTVDLRPRLSAVRVPLLVFYQPEEDLKRVEANFRSPENGYGSLPNVTFDVVLDSGHFIMLDAPDRVSEALLGYIRADRAPTGGIPATLPGSGSSS